MHLLWVQDVVGSNPTAPTEAKEASIFGNVVQRQEQLSHTEKIEGPSPSFPTKQTDSAFLRFDASLREYPKKRLERPTSRCLADAY